MEKKKQKKKQKRQELTAENGLEGEKKKKKKKRKRQESTAEDAENAQGKTKQKKKRQEWTAGLRTLREEGTAIEGEMSDAGPAAATKEALNAITDAVIGAAIAVHRELGPGMLESAYEACLAHEIAQRGLEVRGQVGLPVVYKGVKLECGYRVDLLVENKVIAEVKSVQKLEPIHEAQLLSYLKLSDCRVGLLINFNVTVLKQGIRRLVHDFPG